MDAREEALDRLLRLFERKGEIQVYEGLKGEVEEILDDYYFDRYWENH